MSTLVEGNDFKCEKCKKQVDNAKGVGTKNRNHCPFCLWSLHVDLEVSGDRKSQCQGMMKPIGLTFKHEGQNKWGKEKQGEIMLVHQCEKCQDISINRIAGDDEEKTILEIFENSKNMHASQIDEIKENNIKLLEENDKDEISRQLFGR